jgi:hypothetical protein
MSRNKLERFARFERLITGPTGEVSDVFSKRQRSDLNTTMAGIIGLQGAMIPRPVQAVQDQITHTKKDVGDMDKEFREAISNLLKENQPAPRPAGQRNPLDTFKNALPYGLSDQPAPGGGPQQKINDDLVNLDASLTIQFQTIFLKTFKTIFNEDYQELQEIFALDGITDDAECLDHILRSAFGSMADWPSIDPNSVGIGSIHKLYDLYHKYYNGVGEDGNPDPGVNGPFNINGREFYKDFISKTFMRCVYQGYNPEIQVTPTNFKDTVEGFYDFDPKLWFGNTDNATPAEFAHATGGTDYDSYGHFFKTRHPVTLLFARNVALQPAAQRGDPQLTTTYQLAGTAYTIPIVQAAVNALTNEFSGIYNTGSLGANASDGFYLFDKEKTHCCLFHGGTFNLQEAGPVLTPPNYQFDFSGMNTLNYGNGALATNHTGGGNHINPLAQLLFNSKSTGFHHTRQTGAANTDTRLLSDGAGMAVGRQIITANRQGILATTVAVGGGGAVGHCVHNAAGAGGAGAAAEIPLVAIGNTITQKQHYQLIPNTSSLMQFGGKGIKKEKLKSTFKKILKKKEVKHLKNPVTKLSKKNRIKTGGIGNAAPFLFDRQAAPGEGAAPSLNAKRLPTPINQDVFTKYKKAVQKYIETFTTDAKIQEIRARLNAITNLGIFYHSPTDRRNFGAAPNSHQITFEKLAETFLFCSVITNTIKLLIHFFENIDACLEHFVTTELTVLEARIDAELAKANSNINNLSSSHDNYVKKYISGVGELRKNIGLLVNFLKNNTMHIGNPKAGTVPLGAPAELLDPNEQLVLNLFFGANISHQNTAKAVATITTAVENDAFFLFNHKLMFFMKDTRHGPDNIKIVRHSFFRTVRLLSSNDRALDNGYPQPSNIPVVHPIGEYRKSNASLGGIPFTFHLYNVTESSWIAFYLLLRFRELSNESFSLSFTTNVNQKFTEISETELLKIRQDITKEYNQYRNILGNYRSPQNQKLPVLMKILSSFYFESNKFAEEIANENKQLVKKRGKGTGSMRSVSSFLQIRPGESRRLFGSNELSIQKKIKLFRYKVSTALNVLARMIMNRNVPPTSEDSQFNIYLYIMCRLRNFVYRLYYLNKSFYTESDEKKGKLLKDSGFDVNNISKSTKELFTKLNNVQLVDQNSIYAEWWSELSKKFIKRTTNGTGTSINRPFVFAISTHSNVSKLSFVDVYLIDIFGVTQLDESKTAYFEKTLGYKSTGGMTSRDIKIKKIQYNGKEEYCYSNENHILNLTPLFKKRSLTNPLHSGQKFNKTENDPLVKLIEGKYLFQIEDSNGNFEYCNLNPLFIQGSSNSQLEHILHENNKIKGKFGNKRQSSRNPEHQYQVYQITDDIVKDLNKLRSWCYNLLFSMPTRIDHDDSYFKKNMQFPISKFLFTNSMVSRAVNTFFDTKYDRLRSYLDIIHTYIDNHQTVEFEGKIKRNKNINNTDPFHSSEEDIYITSEQNPRFISREGLLKLGLVFNNVFQ